MKNINLTFRIEGGRYKGRTLQLPSKQTTRSTKSIVKGSLFDTLQNEIVDTIFVEGFGGSGSVGLEAISRGAKHAYFIEKDHDAYSVLKKILLRLIQHGVQHGKGIRLNGYLNLCKNLRLNIKRPMSI